MEEKFDTITLSDGVGGSNEFYVLDNPKIKDQQYIVLYPIDSNDGEVVIMGVKVSKGKNDIYFSVSDKEVEAVFKVLQKNHPEFF